MAVLREIFVDRKDKLAFIIGCFSTFYVSIVGRVYVGELLVFLLYLLYPSALLNLPKQVKRVIMLLWFWTLTAVCSDFYRHIPFHDSLKGISSILFLIALIPFVYWLLKDKPSRWLCFYLGSVISSQFTYYFLTNQTEFGSAEVWQVYSFVPLASCCAVLLYWKGKHKLSYLVLLSFSLWTLFNHTRNVFLTMTLSVFVLLLVDRCKRTSVSDSIRLYHARLLSLLVYVTIGLVSIITIYEQLASNGILGQEAYEKYVIQKNNTNGLASGRTEAFIAASLVVKSPIVGYGSFAKDRTNYVYNYYVKHHMEVRPNMFDYDIDSVENMLPRHSRIFGLWMWHGIGAGLFWLYVVFLFFSSLRNGNFLCEPRLAGLFVLSLMSELWDTFFSPMAVRLPFLFILMFIILLNDKKVYYE